MGYDGNVPVGGLSRLLGQLIGARVEVYRGRKSVVGVFIQTWLASGPFPSPPIAAHP